MPMSEGQREVYDLSQTGLSHAQIAEKLGVTAKAVQKRLNRAQKWLDTEPLVEAGYDLDRPEKTPQEAWDAHAAAFEHSIRKSLSNRWRTIQRPRGPFCIFHSTDEHLDDDAVPLRLIEADIRAAHDLGAIMCHGGDALNNWPMAGRLAKQWAHQQCTAPDALLRLRHFVEIFRPDVWTDGNHEEMNPYLDALIDQFLPPEVIRDYWTVNFVVETGGRPVRVVVSHKFQKGSSWFHKAHGHIREMLEGEEADILCDGHLHSDGVLDHTLPERGHSALCVASAGYKVVDKYARRISRSNGLPKLRGRAHWIICDPDAGMDQSLAVAFKCPRQAEAYMSGLQNLAAV